MKDRLRALIQEHIEVPADDAPLVIDSLSMVTLIEAIEDEFAIRVAPRDVNGDNFGSIDALARYIAQKQP